VISDPNRIIPPLLGNLHGVPTKNSIDRKDRIIHSNSVDPRPENTPLQFDNNSLICLPFVAVMQSGDLRQFND
jgi:hypothetical protein